jgi:uncharacterized protein YjhX (UPF0386 family)
MILSLFIKVSNANGGKVNKEVECLLAKGWKNLSAEVYIFSELLLKITYLEK